MPVICLLPLCVAASRCSLRHVHARMLPFRILHCLRESSEADVYQSIQQWLSIHLHLSFQQEDPTPFMFVKQTATPKWTAVAPAGANSSVRGRFGQSPSYPKGYGYPVSYIVSSLALHILPHSPSGMLHNPSLPACVVKNANVVGHCTCNSISTASGSHVGFLFAQLEVSPQNSPQNSKKHSVEASVCNVTCYGYPIKPSRNKKTAIFHVDGRD